MIVKWLSGVALSRVFGDGFAADLAGRGTVYLADEVRKALGREDEEITRVRLRPGERYTVVARPPATRQERKLFSQQRALADSYDRLTRPRRRQLRAARQLVKAQRRLDKADPGSRKYARRRAEAEQLGLRFDRVMRPSRKQVKVAGALTTVTRQLEASRATSLEHARATSGLRRRRTRVRVYD